jgi:hypothetical protein
MPTPIFLAFAIGNLALAEYADGPSRHAETLLETALELIQSVGQQTSPMNVILHMACGERARTDGDPRGATRWFDEALDILGPTTRSIWRANAHLLHACASHALGAAAAETRKLEMADAILDRLPDPGDLRTRPDNSAGACPPPGTSPSSASRSRAGRSPCCSWPPTD